MKYVVYIILIALISTVGLFLMDRSSHKTTVKDYVIRVNGKLITASELAQQLNQQPALLGDSTNYVESLITRELLIQEAKRQKIDQEEPFRRALKNFYEQSLIKILIDRKMRSISYTPTQEEIRAYRNLMGRKVSFTLTKVDNSEINASAKDVVEKNASNQISDLFDNLALPLRISLLFLKPGEKTRPLNILGGRYIIKLKQIGPSTKVDAKLTDEEIATIITEFRREQMFKKWLDELRKKAKVEVHTKNIEIERP